MQQLLPHFVTTKMNIIAKRILAPTENAFNWRPARWTSEIFRVGIVMMQLPCVVVFSCGFRQSAGSKGSTNVTYRKMYEEN